MQTNNVIEVVVALIDKATAPLAKLNKSIGQFKGLAVAAAGAWTLNKFIANIAEADRTTAKLDVAFKNLGATVGVSRQRMDDIATAIQNTTTFSDDAVKAGEALLLTFTKVRGEVFERTIKVAADMAAMLGTDVTGAIRMLGRSLQDPQIGMMMLRRAGVALTQQQREMIKEMIKVGDVIGAQTKLLDLLEEKSRGMAEAMRNTLSGAFAALQNQIGEILEGDRGSFKSLIKAMNDTSKALQDPRIREGIDAVISLLVILTATIGKLIIAIGAPLANAFGTMIGWFDKLGVAIANSIEDWNEWWAARLGLEYSAEDRKRQQGTLAFFDPTRAEKGYDKSEQAIKRRLDRNVSEQERAAEKIKAIQERIALGYGGAFGGGKLPQQLREAQAELERLKKLHKEIELSRPLEFIKITVPRIEGMDNVENVLEQAERVKAGLATEAEKIAKELSAARAAIDAALALPDLPDEKRKEYEDAILRINKQSADATKKLQEAADKGVEIPVALQKGALQDAQDELARLLQGFDRETRTAREQSLAQWTDYSNKLAALLAAGPEAGGISFKQFNERLSEFAKIALEAAAAFPGAGAQIVAELRKLREEGRLTAEQFEQLDVLSEIKITVPKIELPKPEDLMAPFRERMAQTLQTTFADAFMNIGKGWSGTVRLFLDGFKRILAEAAAMRLARFFELDKIVAGVPTKGLMGKIIGAVMPPLIPKPTAGAQEAARKYEEKVGLGAAGAVVAAATRTPGAECAAQCASGVVEKVAHTIAEPIQESSKGILALLKSVTGGLWKVVTGMLTKLWDFIKAAVAVIRAMATGGTSGGGDIISTAVKAVGAFFGASAGGGKVKGRQPRKVGEEGPEWIVPGGDAEVMNERQVRFAGAGLLAALGALTVGIEAAAQDIGALRPREPARITKPEARAPAVNVPTIKVIAPEVRVPAAKAPVVNVKVPAVSAPKAAAPVVKVAMPRAPSAAPIVNITVPRAVAPAVSVAAPKVAVPRVTAPAVNIAAPKIVMPKVAVPAANVQLPKEEPVHRPIERSSPVPVTLNFSPVYHFTTTGETKDGKVDPRLLAYIERRDQQNKVEIMEMLRRNGFGRMTR